MKSDKSGKKQKENFVPFSDYTERDISGLTMDAKMEKDADSMVVKPVEYAASEYSASSEPPPVSTTSTYFCNETSFQF